MVGLCAPGKCAAPCTNLLLRRLNVLCEMQRFGWREDRCREQRGRRQRQGIGVRCARLLTSFSLTRVRSFQCSWLDADPAGGRLWSRRDHPLPRVKGRRRTPLRSLLLLFRQEKFFCFLFFCSQRRRLWRRWCTQVNAKDNFGNTALFNAVYEGHLEAVKELLKLGADKNATGFASLNNCANLFS